MQGTFIFRCSFAATAVWHSHVFVFIANCLVMLLLICTLVAKLVLVGLETFPMSVFQERPISVV